MYNEPITVHEETTYDGKRIKIATDPEPFDPRENDNLGTFIHWHRRYDLGDRQVDETELEALRRGGIDELERYLKLKYGATHVIPVGLLDHSGLHVYAGGGSHWTDSGGWDSGTVGVIFDTRESREELIGTPPERVRDVLLSEISEYDDYLTGNVYGYVVESPHGQVIDSCWGYYPDNDESVEGRYGYCLSEARAAARHESRYDGC